MKGALYDPKNPEYAATRDTESTKGVLESVLLKLSEQHAPVSLGEMRDAFYQRIPEVTKRELTLNGFARLEERAPHDNPY